MARFYSRLASVEEKKSILRAFFFGILTILTAVFLLTLGLSPLAKLSGFLTNLRSPQKSLDKADTTAPAPPRINDLPDYTNKTSIDMGGFAEPGAKVKIFINNNEQDVQSGDDGKFTSRLTLKDGENTIYALAIDASNNQSQKSDVKKIIFDNKPPDITIDSPSDGSQFFGSKERQITIKGSTKAGSDLTINDRVVLVDAGGNFSYTMTLSEGENNLNFKAVDKAGNSSEKSIKLTFTP